LAFQAILNGFPSVDSFFFIGATLLSYITLKELDKTMGGNIQFWIMYYVHRYIRLTGVYALVIGITATLLKFFAGGPYSTIVQSEIDNCKNYWWTNILYINNFKNVADSPPMCMPVSWYLANDMQFFIISPLVLYPLWKYPKIGFPAGILWLVFGTIVPMVIVYINDFPLSVSFMTYQSLDYFFDFYVTPWCRFQPYISGLLFGWILHRMRDQAKLKLNSFIVLWIWAALGATGAAVTYGLYSYQLEFTASGNSALVGSLATRIAYNGLHRLAWSVCLGWVILACVKGAGGPINHILSWHAWIPLARISYCTYLVHFTVIGYVTSLPSFSVSFSHPLALYWILALMCLSIFVAYIAVILLEAPIVTLEKILFQAVLGHGKSTDKKKDNKQQNGENP
jgi:peptidoglycan/LPS O-acetylase OafA/YrhL